MICDGLNGVKSAWTIHTAAFTPWTGMQVLWYLLWLGAGVWGLEGNQGVDCCCLWGEGPRGVQGEITAGKALGRELGSQGGEATLQSLRRRRRCSRHYSLSFSPPAGASSCPTEEPPGGWPLRA